MHFVQGWLPLQFPHLVHHHQPYVMAGQIAGKPRPFGAAGDIELRLFPMQLDQMLGHQPEIFFVHALPRTFSRLMT